MLKRWLLSCVAILFTALFGVMGGEFCLQMDSSLNNRETVYFEISKGQGVKAIADGLYVNGLINHPFWFRLFAWKENAATKLKFGEYEIPPATTSRQLLALFASGKVRHYSLTLVEGWTFKQMAEAMKQQPNLVHLIDGKPPAEVMGLIDAPGEQAEGRFYPDTYFFSKGTSDIEVLKRAYHKMQTVLADEWQARGQDLLLHNPYETLILASIVEKETGLAEERNKIAGVFSRRLSKKMLLQTDPSVIYGMGESYTGNIRKEDLLRDTPFNSYVHLGLPPTPICMPGIGSIRAVLHPDAESSLYFVARGDGGHVFSDNLTDHNKAVNQFQKKRHD